MDHEASGLRRAGRRILEKPRHLRLRMNPFGPGIADAALTFDPLTSLRDSEDDHLNYPWCTCLTVGRIASFGGLWHA